MMRLLSWVLAPVLAFSLCGSDEGSGNRTDESSTERTVTQGTYSFKIGPQGFADGSAEDDASLQFSGTVTNWSPDIGTLVLGTEDSGEPLAQLLTGIDISGGYVEFPGATLSTTDVRVGTGAEINGKLYDGVTYHCLDDRSRPVPNLIEIGSNFIKARFCLDMVRVDLNGAGEMITVRGEFTAISK